MSDLNPAVSVDQTNSVMTVLSAPVASGSDIDWITLSDKYKALDNTILDCERYAMELNSNRRVGLITFKGGSSAHGTNILMRLFDVNRRLDILKDKALTIQLDLSNPGIANALSNISFLEFQDVVIEKPFSGSLIFKLKFPENILLIVNIPSGNLDLSHSSAVFTLIDNDDIVVSNYNTLDNIVNGMSAYLRQ